MKLYPGLCWTITNTTHKVTLVDGVNDLRCSCNDNRCKYITEISRLLFPEYLEILSKKEEWTIYQVNYNADGGSISERYVVTVWSDGVTRCDCYLYTNCPHIAEVLQQQNKSSFFARNRRVRVPE